MESCYDVAARLTDQVQILLDKEWREWQKVQLIHLEEGYRLDKRIDWKVGFRYNDILMEIVFDICCGHVSSYLDPNNSNFQESIDYWQLLVIKELKRRIP